MTSPDAPDWATDITNADVHAGQQDTQWQRPISPFHLLEFGAQLIEQFLRRVVQAIVGFFIPGGGSAFNQLASWGAGVNGGLQNFATLVTGINFSQAPHEVWADIVDVFVSPLEKFAELVGGFISTLAIPILDPSKILNLPGLFSDVQTGWQNMYNAWFGGGGSGTTFDVTYTVEAIKDAIINGENVVTFAFDEVNWPVPAHTVCTAILVGGGLPGGVSGDFSVGGGTGGDGGLHGSFKAVGIDLTGITHLDIQVGSAGNLSYIREANSTPHTGQVIVASAPHGSAGGIASTYGFTPTTSLPGTGGKGGIGPGSAGQPGGSTPSAAGGAGGASFTFGDIGAPGGSVSAGAQTKCGGAGGGGGGAASAVFNGGGPGGAGGYPGGGGGGGGASRTAPGVAGGPGAPGVVWLFHR